MKSPRFSSKPILESLESRWVPAILNSFEFPTLTPIESKNIVFVDKALVAQIPSTEFQDAYVVSLDESTDSIDQMTSEIIRHK